MNWMKYQIMPMEFLYTKIISNFWNYYNNLDAINANKSQLLD